MIGGFKNNNEFPPETLFQVNSKNKQNKKQRLNDEIFIFLLLPSGGVSSGDAGI